MAWAMMAEFAQVAPLAVMAQLEQLPRRCWIARAWAAWKLAATGVVPVASAVAQQAQTVRLQDAPMVVAARAVLVRCVVARLLRV